MDMEGALSVKHVFQTLPSSLLGCSSLSDVSRAVCVVYNTVFPRSTYPCTSLYTCQAVKICLHVLHTLIDRRVYRDIVHDSCDHSYECVHTSMRMDGGNNNY